MQTIAPPHHQYLPPARHADSLLAIHRYLGKQFDYGLNGPSDVKARPNQIVDLVSGKVIRG